MFRYLIDIFCKDTLIGLCEVDNKRISDVFKSCYPDILFRQSYVKDAFKNSFTIDQTVYHL